MKRRALLTAAFGAIGTAIFSSKVQAAEIFKKDEIDLFGHKVIQYTWPSDRPIIMERDVRSIVSIVSRRGMVEQIQEGVAVTIPVLDSRECPLRKESIDSFCGSEGPKDFFYYLFRVDGYPTLYGLLGSPTPMIPVTDHFTRDLERSEKRMLARKRA